MCLITSMRLFGCSHTHFGMGSAYFSYLLSNSVGYRSLVPRLHLPAEEALLLEAIRVWEQD